MVAMMATDDTVSKEFPEFLEIIQKQGISMLYNFLQIKKKLCEAGHYTRVVTLRHLNPVLHECFGM